MKPTEPGKPLDCASAQRLIEAFLLDELGAGSGAALRAHLAGCVACTTELGGATRLIQLLADLPAPLPAPDLDERIILAAIADRQRRHERRSWLNALPALVLRGAMRTTGTLVATVVSVALLGAAFVFAAGSLLTQVPQLGSGPASVAPEMTPTITPTPVLTVAPTVAPQVTKAPAVAPVTPAPTPAPVVTVAPATPAPTPAPTPAITPEPTPAPTASAEPTPIPTEKPKRTPVPSASPSPSDSAAPSPAPTPSP